MKVEDKFGNYLSIKSISCGMNRIELVTPDYTIILGVIDRSQRTFILNMDQRDSDDNPVLKYALSSKFLIEATTFDFVDIAGIKHSLSDLRFHLLIPYGFKSESFSDIVYLPISDEVPKFKNHFEAMLYYCDVYEKKFNEGLPDVPWRLDQCTLCNDMRVFIESSLLTIRNYAGMKKGGVPDFMRLTKLYKYLIQKENGIKDH